MNNKTNNVKKLNTEEKRIQKEVDDYLRKVKEAEIQNEINHRIADAAKNTPGKRYI